MERRATWFSVVALIAAAAIALAGLAAPLPASAARAAAASSPSASGLAQLTVDGSQRVFTFQAQTLLNGAVTGQAQVIIRPQNFILHLAINCLDVAGGVATMSGVVTRSSNPAFVGKLALFSVQDSGLGASAPFDRISLVEIWTPGNPDAPVDCHGAIIHPLLPVEQGTLQVQPGPAPIPAPPPRSQQGLGNLQICAENLTEPTTFTVGRQAFTVAPAPGTPCIAVGTFPVGSIVTIQETVAAGTVIQIDVSPPNRLTPAPPAPAPNPFIAIGRVTVTIGPGLTQVTFSHGTVSGSDAEAEV